MSVRVMVLAVAAVFGLATAGWAQGGGRQCGGGGQSMMRGGGGQSTMRSGGQGMMTGNTMQMQQLQAQQLLAMQLQAAQYQAQLTGLDLMDANALGMANFARIQAARKAQLQAGK